MFPATSQFRVYVDLLTSPREEEVLPFHGTWPKLFPITELTSSQNWQFFQGIFWHNDPDKTISTVNNFFSHQIYLVLNSIALKHWHPVICWPWLAPVNKSHLCTSMSNSTFSDVMLFSLKWTVAEVVTPWELANITHQGFFFPKEPTVKSLPAYHDWHPNPTHQILPSYSFYNALSSIVPKYFTNTYFRTVSISHIRKEI